MNDISAFYYTVTFLTVKKKIKNIRNFCKTIGRNDKILFNTQEEIVLKQKKFVWNLFPYSLENLGNYF